ncbi:unnamed protein product [Pseudo-nitzschia multistriata]|uniref:Rhodanese domain-containing protein n=1 Tax=Pseudo-nitzschia multistriata TaxID=183589 RepID=A0A448Z6C8_9STRA|nr:unnamed protein product [Pseudo-nitzschia multistriata]
MEIYDDDDVDRRIRPQQVRKTELKLTNGDDETNDTKMNKRRRLSKKERKDRKNLQKKNKMEVKSLQTNGHDNNQEDVEGEEERIRVECMETYSPIDIPEEPPMELASQGEKSKVNNDKKIANDEGECRTLGKWFPNAILIKSISYTNTGQFITNKNCQKENRQMKANEEDLIVDNPRSSLVLFYQYTTNDGSSDVTNNERNKKWDRRQLQLLITYLSTIAHRRNLGGRIRVATEGVNATISAVDTTECTAKAALRHFAEDLRRFDPRVFSHTDFKYLDDLPADRQFKEFKIFPVQELVFYDIGETDAPLDSDKLVKKYGNNSNSESEVSGGGIHLDASSFHEMLQKDNTVVIDVRNNYETILGRFDGQQRQKEGPTEKIDSRGCSSSGTNGGAEYIDPKMRKSTDFKSWLAKPTTQEKLGNKTVLMYCTGGIRCERASAYLRSEMKDKVKGVYQLKGGIERYLKQFKDGGFWRGKNFVFDKREAVGVDNPHGDGGILRKVERRQRKMHEKKTEGSPLTAKCCVCGDSWDRYVGKKKCLTCGVPVLMCEKCMSLKPDKTPGMELKVRCPLCVEEGVTVLAKELVFTANGIKNKIVSSAKAAISGNSVEKVSGDYRNKCEIVDKEYESKKNLGGTGKAADSVLKWGGGHAINKKKLKKMKRRVCQFGAECVRKDCFFYHPQRESSFKATTEGKK